MRILFRPLSLSILGSLELTIIRPVAKTRQRLHSRRWPNKYQRRESRQTGNTVSTQSVTLAAIRLRQVEMSWTFWTLTRETWQWHPEPGPDDLRISDVCRGGIQMGAAFPSWKFRWTGRKSWNNDHLSRLTIDLTLSQNRELLSFKTKITFIF